MSRTTSIASVAMTMLTVVGIAILDASAQPPATPPNVVQPVSQSIPAPNTQPPVDPAPSFLRMLGRASRESRTTSAP